MKTLLLIILFFGLTSFNPTPRKMYYLHTISWWDYQPGRPHQGICLNSSQLYILWAVLYDFTAKGEVNYSEHRDKMYWKIFTEEKAVSGAFWYNGEDPIRPIQCK